jgi:hypothetical protein
MADHAVEVELYYDGQWNAAPAFTSDGIALTRGAPGEGQESPPSSAALTLDNRTRDYSPTNPTGPLYGLVGRNTPMRVSADGAVRSTTEVAAWAPDQNLRGNVAWTAVEGGGLLRRLQQGNTPLRSALYRAIAGADNPPSYWWDLETGDGRALTSVPSTIVGGPPLLAAPASAGGDAGHRLSGVVGGTVVGPYGGSTAIDMSGGGQLSTTQMHTSAAGPFRFEVAVQFKEPIGEFDAGAILRIRMLDTIIGVFAGVAPGAELAIELSDDGSFVADTESVIIDDGAWHHVRLDLTYAGADTGYSVAVDGVTVLSGTATSVGIHQIDELVLSPAGDVDAAAHLAFWDGSTPTNVDTADAFTGHEGERAGQRFLRLCGEEGITAYVVGDADDTQTMGPQSAKTFVDLLRECVRVDDGLLFEPRDELALTMRTGRSRYNQSAALTLDFAGGQLAPGLRPVTDDRATRNDVTAKRIIDGESARVVRESGPLNVADPTADPQGVGRYDTSVEVNAAFAASMLDQASWHLAKGTVDEPRYPSLTVDLDAAPALAAALDAVGIGDRIEVENLPADWQAGNASLLVLGDRDAYPPGAGDFRRLVTLNTAPASVYEIGVVGANDGSTDLRGQAVDTDLSTLASGITSTGTTLSVASTGGVLWTTDADDWNPALNGGGLYLLVGGEQIRVTNITGASSPQTFTVVRSTNGVVKTHAAGTQVHVAYPIRVGL